MRRFCAKNMGYNGNRVLTISVLYVKIVVSMKVDKYEHAKAKDHRLQSVVFHLGYLSFSFPPNHLLMRLIRTPAATESKKYMNMLPSFLCKEVKTLTIIYHIFNIISIHQKEAIQGNDGTDEDWIASASPRNDEGVGNDGRCEM